MILSATVGIFILNAPTRRLARQLELGNKYLEEHNYEMAALAFEKAIQIDERCMAAYLSGIEACRYLNDPDNLLVFYEKALKAVRSLESETLAADMETVVSIYLAVEDVYTDEESMLAVLEEGYEKSGQDRKILESLSRYLKAYLDLLMENNNFQQVKELLEKYEPILPNFDFTFYLDEIERLEQKKIGELSSQLELPFSAEDVTLFGYKLTEDHFDDLVADFNLLSNGDGGDSEQVWSKSANDNSYSIWAVRYSNGGRLFNVINDEIALIYYYVHAPIDDLQISEEGVNFIFGGDFNKVMIDDEGVGWLQSHHVEGCNLPLLSCLGNKIDDWYQSVPVEKIKEKGEYNYYRNEGTECWKWDVKDPIEVSLYESRYNNGILHSRLQYKFGDNIFRIEAVLNNDGVVNQMWYIWGIR